MWTLRANILLITCRNNNARRVRPSTNVDSIPWDCDFLPQMHYCNSIRRSEIQRRQTETLHWHNNFTTLVQPKCSRNSVRSYRQYENNKRHNRKTKDWSDQAVQALIDLRMNGDCSQKNCINKSQCS